MLTEMDLEQLLDLARESNPSTRLPDYRDAIARHGSKAIEPLATWIYEPAFAAFAIRTLERVVVLDPTAQADVVNALARVDRANLSPPIQRDLSDALRRLGVDPARTRPRRLPSHRQPVVSPGRPGRNYWAMRTSPWERPYIWSEATSGRLRQGWGWAPEQDLRRIAELTRRGAELSEEQQMAWPSRRMLGTEPDGMRPGDLILTPNLPEWGRMSLFEVTGSYRYEPDAPRTFDDRFGHVLPVRLLEADIDRAGPLVSEGLRATTRNPGRLWNIAGYGGDVERLVDPSWVRVSGGGRPWTELEYAVLFGALPPDERRPAASDIQRMATLLARSVGAIEWQWDDGAAYVSGRSASTTSDALKSWLDQHWSANHGHAEMPDRA